MRERTPASAWIRTARRQPGEAGVIVAGLGQQVGAFSPTTDAIIVGMSLLTSVVAPPVLKRRRSAACGTRR